MEHHTIISVKNLVKFYGKSVGVNDISFEVEEGEIFGFLGPNGAGKTTTIRILLDLLRPDSGEVRVFGKEIRRNSLSIRKRLGYLPGEFSVYENLRVMDFFSLMAGIRDGNFDPATPLIKRFDLSKADMQKKIKALSHGTLQKLGIIQALYHAPRLLILDEPTTGLDPLMKEVLYEVLLEVSRKGTTIFFSSHNLDEVEKLCKRVAIIRRGKIVGLESIEALKAKVGQVLELSLPEDADIPDLPNSELISSVGTQFRFIITGDINPVLKTLSSLEIKEISISKPQLEDIFMQFYQEEKEGEDVVL